MPFFESETGGKIVYIIYVEILMSLCIFSKSDIKGIYKESFSMNFPEISVSCRTEQRCFKIVLNYRAVETLKFFPHLRKFFKL